MFTCRDCGAGVNDPEAHFCNVASRKSKKIIDLPKDRTTTVHRKKEDAYASGGEDTLPYHRPSQKSARSQVGDWEKTERIAPGVYANGNRIEVESYVSSSSSASYVSESRGPASLLLQPTSFSGPSGGSSIAQPSAPAASKGGAAYDFLANSYNKLFKGGSTNSNTSSDPPSAPASVVASNRMSRMRPVSVAPRASDAVALSEIMVFRDAKSVLCTECRAVFQQDEEFVRAGRGIVHTLCCVCATCGLTVHEDTYGSDGWIREGTRFICGDCVERGEGGRGGSGAEGPPPCDTCGRPLPESEALTHASLPGRHHAACLACQKCARPMSERIGPGRPLHVRNGRPLCHTCAVSVCAGCKRPIERHARVVAALGKKYHTACLVCEKCGAAFPDKSFYVFDNMALCQMCYHIANGSICCGCDEPIEGPCASVIEGRFHPECFTCVTCGELLDDVYYSYENQSYCEIHIRELQRSKKDARKAERRQTQFEKI